MDWMCWRKVFFAAANEKLRAPSSSVVRPFAHSSTRSIRHPPFHLEIFNWTSRQTFSVSERVAGGVEVAVNYKNYFTRKSFDLMYQPTWERIVCLSRLFEAAQKESEDEKTLTDNNRFKGINLMTTTSSMSMTTALMLLLLRRWSIEPIKRMPLEEKRRRNLLVKCTFNVSPTAWSSRASPYSGRWSSHHQPPTISSQPPSPPNALISL